ncbi:MAG: hydantoinase B/oxoprolinase family protein [Chloroflexi bacterium]|nr:hydantoinase B/oxoprolinase family protein [Chloroflexota bacterium]
MPALRDRLHLLPGLVYDRHPYGRAPGRDPELLVRGIEPPSPLELEGMATLSAIDLEVFQHKMTSIVEEAREVYMALSISEGIVTGDMNTSIFTPEGDPAVVATGIYFHTLLNYAPVKYILKYYRDDPTVGLHDGDVYFFNDPTCGGVHSFDMFVTAPIFCQGELVGWAEVGGHQGECGSISPGGFSPKATCRWEEGLQAHALRIGEHWELRRDLLDFLLNSVRNPFVFASDLKARVATCKRIRDRLAREVERRGVAQVVGGLRKTLAVTGDLARQRIRQVNDGIYRGVLFNDTVGTEPGLVRLPTTVIKEGDEIVLLVQGASPENGRGPMHCTWHLMKAAMGVYLFTYFFRGLPPNIGLFDPITVLVEGPSVANSSVDLAHGEGTSIAAMNVQNLQIIGSKMLFDSPFKLGVAGTFSRNVLVNVYAGINSYGYLAANFPGANNAAGQGARFDQDGEHSCGFYWASVTDIGEAEEADMRLPPVTLARRIDRDFHGFGKYRGGSPMVDISMAPPGRGCLMTSWGSADRVSHNPGLFGGYAGPPNPRFVIRNTNVLELLAQGDPRLKLTQYDLAREQPIQGDYLFEASSQATESFAPGDVFIYSIGPGGGYGDVLERDPDLVMDDLRTDAISHHVARTVYRVVYDQTTLEVDRAATERERQRARDERKQRGKPFAAFAQEWLAKRPSDDKLKHYGHWPEPRLERYDKPFWGLYE